MSKQARNHCSAIAASRASEWDCGRLALKRAAPDVARAAIAVLEAMIRESVVLTSQRICTAEHFQAPLARAPASERLVIVSQRLEARNQFAGKMLMVASVERALMLAALIAGWSGRPSSLLNRIDVDALKEMANIVLGRCLDALEDVIALKPRPCLPALLQGTRQMVLTSLRPSPSAVCIETCLSAAARELELTLVAALESSIFRAESAGACRSFPL